MKVYPRGSVEFHEIPLSNGDTPILPTSVAATPWNIHPTTEWASPAAIGGLRGLMVGSYEPGYYRTWARVTSTPETPVVESEPFTIT